MLNSEQKKAVECIDKPLVVIAGPGTGKTTLIVQKINYLISEKGFNENEVLAITFTNKAAEEMSSRVEVLSNKPFFAKTFHEFCLQIIEDYQKYISEVDLNYTLIDDTNQLLFFLENIAKWKLSSVEIKNNINLLAYELQSVISRLKDFGYALKDFEGFVCKDMQAKLDVFLAYSKYELYKKKNNFIDFGDLLLHVRRLLENNVEVRREIQGKYRYILVDEFQDTNQVQLDIIKLISSNGNITIVGDQKQSIYGFRGANYKNLEDFKKHYEEFEEVYLSKNYRSSKSVINNVNKLILNFAKKEEVLDCESDIKGQVEVVEANNEKSQFAFVANKIIEILDKKKDASIGVLFRRKAELKQMSVFLKKLGINFRSAESLNFFEFENIKSILNQIKIVFNPKEANQELFKLLSDTSLRSETVRKISRLASIREKSIYLVISEDNISEYAAENEVIRNVYSKIEELVELKNSKISLYDLIREIIIKFNNYQSAICSKLEDEVMAINKFLEFVGNYLRVYKNHDLERFLLVCEHTKSLDLYVDLEDVSGGIELLTIHASKGKEFDYVIMPYLNERRFPVSFKRSKFELLAENRFDFLDEEKRLFFVGLSRAKLDLFLVYAKRYGDNKVDSRPSEFLKLIGLKVKNYKNEIAELVLSFEDEVKSEIIANVKNLLLDNQFEGAKAEIELLIDLFAKKSLTHFIKDVKHSDYDYYMDKILNGKKKGHKLNLDMSKMVYSVSQLKIYESCPKKYLYQYIYKIPAEARHYFDFGTSVHEVLELLIKEMNIYSDEVLFSRGVAFLKKYWVSKGYLNANQEKEYFEMGIEAIRRFIAKQREIAGENRKTIGTEEKFVIDFNGKKIMGFIDRIDEVDKGIEILDYKTSNVMENKSQLRENLQLFVYATAVKELYKKVPYRVGLWYLIHDKIENVLVSEIEMDKLKEKILKLIDGIESLNFTANPSFFACNFCDFNKICKDSK